MDRAGRIASIVADCQERQACGEPVDAEALLAENPDIAEELRFHFEVADLFARSRADPPGLEAWVPRQIGEYRIVREIARGGMGVVYEAEQVSLGRRVALKVLSPAFTRVERAVKRFRREGRAAAALHHTNIVPVHAMGQHEGLWYYAMELVNGQPLHQVLAELRAERDRRGSSCSAITSEHLGTDPEDRAYAQRVAAMFAGVADGLHAAHKAGVIHRDVKPSNLLLDQDGTLKIVDFGLARLGGGEPSMTITGDLLGTPMYMSPEQALAKRKAIDHRTDVYSLGATLYEVLTLRPPFEGGSFQELCSDIVAKEPTRPRRLNRSCPADLETILLKAMEKEPDARFATAGALARDLQSFAEGRNIRARRINVVKRAWRRVKRHKVRSALAAAVLAAAVIAGIVAQRAQRESARAERETERARQAEYELLIARSQGAMVAAGSQPEPATVGESRIETLSRMNRLAAPDADALEILARAAALVPARPEAYWLRIVVGGRTPADRLDDLEAARVRGLAPRAYHLARAQLLEQEAHWDEADAERIRAERHPVTPESDLFEGMLLIDAGRLDEALERLDRCLDVSTPEARVLRGLALRNRARIHTGRGDFAAALTDLLGLQQIGDGSAGLRVQIASLWRRMGKDEVARKAFEEVLRDVRDVGAPGAWRALCVACRMAEERSWHERAAEEGMTAHPDSVVLVREGIEALRNKGALEEAEALCKRALGWASDYHVLRGELATVLRLQGNYEAAKTAYERALEANDKCVRCLWGLGVALSCMEQDARAKEYFETVTRLDPRCVNGYHSLGISLQALGQYEDAERAYRRALRICANVPEVRTQLGILLFDRERFEEALGEFEKILEVHGESAQVHFNRGNVLTKLDRLDDALAAYAKALEIDPRMEGPHNNRAVVHVQRGELAQALVETDAELEIRPDWPRGHGTRGAILAELGQPAKAIGSFREAVRLDPAYAQAHRSLATLLLEEAKKPKEAVEAWTRAIELDPDDVKAYVERGCIHANHLGDPGRALEDFESAIKAAARSPGKDHEADLYHAHRNSGVVLREMRRFERAIEAYRDALRLKPADLPASFELVGLLRQAGKDDDALAVLADLSMALPENAQAHYVRGEIHLGHGRYEEAMAGYTKAMELQPASRSPYGGALHTLYESGAFEEALAMSRRALGRFGREPYFRTMQVRALRATGRAELARERALGWASGETPEHGALQYAYMAAAAGRRDRAQEILSGYQSEDPEEMWVRASVHAVLGDGEAALGALALAVKAGHRRPAAAAPDPDLHALLDGNAGYAELMRQIHTRR